MAAGAFWYLVKLLLNVLIFYGILLFAADHVDSSKFL